jgi:hypothetical protein
VASIAPAGFDRFGAISANARTVAFSTSTGTITIADRPTTADPFGMPQPLNPGAVALANGRVALEPTGLVLVATLADGSSFASFARSAVGAPFSPSNGKEFAAVAAMRSESGGTFSEPVVSADQQSFFYLLALPNNPPVFYESTWDRGAKAWTTGRALPNPEFAIAGASLRRRPTGASFDDRTLFFFDEVAGHERAAWRSSPAAPFDRFVDLPLVPEAAPDDDCVTLYFHGADTNGQGLFTASAR